MTSGDATIGRAEAARRLGVTERTVDRYVREERLDATKNPVTRRVTFDAGQIEELRRTRDGEA